MAGKHKLKKRVKFNHKPVVVGTGEASHSSATVHHAPKIKRKKLITICGAGLVVILLILIPLLHQHSIDRKRDNLVSQAAALLDPADVPKLEPYITQIKQQSDYTSNPDYLYVLAIYYVNTGNTALARTTYNQLTKVYDAKTGYHNANLKSAADPKDLLVIINASVTLSKQAQTNSNNLAPRSTE